MTQRPYLNAGCGKVILPGEPPPDAWLVDQAIYQYPLWHNVDKVDLPGVDECVDLFAYPWPWPDNHFDGALLSHLVEHIPHDVRIAYPALELIKTEQGIYGSWGRQQEFGGMQDGWFAFFSELTRVLTPGAVAHIIHPYAWSAGAVTDPTHTRYITEHTWTHQLAKADVNGQFAYAVGECNLELIEPPKMWVSPLFTHLLSNPNLPYIQEGRHNWNERIVTALQTQINVIYALYVKLEAVK